MKVMRIALTPEKKQVIKVPVDSRLLSVEIDGNSLCVFVLADENEKRIEEVGIYRVETGIDEMGPLCTFLGTIPMARYSYSEHVFYKKLQKIS